VLKEHPSAAVGELEPILRQESALDWQDPTLPVPRRSCRSSRPQRDRKPRSISRPWPWRCCGGQFSRAIETLANCVKIRT
jgi:hypothetical protein